MEEGRYHRPGLCWPCAALAVGLTWGVGLWLLGVVATYTATWGHAFINALGSIYWGFAASWPGAFWGLFWGFIDGFIGTAVVVWLYNVFGGREHRLGLRREEAHARRGAVPRSGEAPGRMSGEPARQPPQERERPQQERDRPQQ
jgi:hypothetical protein